MTKPHAIFAVGAALLVVCTSAFGQATPPAQALSEAELIAVLRSESPLEQKAAACRRLGQVGTPQAVPALAALLSDEKLFHMARYALEQIPDPAVEEALRQAATKLQGKPLAGVVASLGARCDARSLASLDLLGHILRDGDPEVVSAAALALGKIASPQAAKVLERAAAGEGDLVRPALRQAVQPALWDALLHCAASLAAGGRREDAGGIFDRLRAGDVSMPVRVAATRGAILARRSDQAALLTELLSDKSQAMFNLALGLAIELPGEAVTAALARQVATLPADRQALLIDALGNRGDVAAAPALRAVTGCARPAVRIAAIRALARLGDLSALPILLEAASAENKGVAEAAAGALVRLPGGEVDAALIDRVRTSDTDQRIIAIDCLARRQAASATAVLLKVAAEGEPPVRLAALKALGDIAALADLPPIVRLLLAAGEEAERDAAERALIAVCALAGAGDKDSCADKILGPLGQTQGEQKAALLRILETIRSDRALQAVRDALKDPSAEVRGAAVRALCNWQIPDVADDLLELARNSTDPTHKVLAVRGYVRLAYDGALPAGKRLEMCRQALPLADRDDEKRLLLGALGAVPSPEALALIEPHLDVPAVREEACAAVVAVVGKLAQSPDPGESGAMIVRTLEKVRRTGRNPRTLEIAKTLLELTRQRMPK